MKNIISFSVWGNDPKYLKGCIKNVIIAKDIYPGWICRFYCDSQVDKATINKLKNLGAEIEIMDTINSPWEGLFWRFYPASEEDVNIFISRDIDSRINEREKAAVDEWLLSNKDIHVMRDHIEHNVPILGGMWGCRNGILKDIKNMIKCWEKNDCKGSDQDFLKDVIWKDYSKYVLAHDKYYNGIIIEQVVTDEKEYFAQRERNEKYIQYCRQQRLKYVYEQESQGIFPTTELLTKLFPNTDDLPPVKYNNKKNVIIDYYYHPIKTIGEHEIRPFPTHSKMSYGTHVGEIIE